jgi:HSP20 family protein
MLMRWNTGWNDLDDVFQAMNQLRLQMDRLAADTLGGRLWDDRGAALYASSWPRTNLVDAGDHLLVSAEVPGLGEQDIRISLTQDVLTISGARQVQVPEGYRVHRQERSSLEFARSFPLPCRVDAERTSATVKDGILTVTLAKSPEAMPRQIAIKTT